MSFSDICGQPARALSASLSLALLVGCEGEPAVDEDSALKENPQDLMSQAGYFLEPQEFSALDLGARVPSSEQTFQLAGPGGAAGMVSTYVACSADVISCEPSELSADAVYTYVLEVVPGAPASVFRTSSGIELHQRVAGFDTDQAAETLGGDSRLTMTCEDGALVWAVSGDREWGTGEPLTVFWQSSQPPTAREDAYQLIVEGNLATGPGLYPEGDGPGECA